MNMNLSNNLIESDLFYDYCCSIINKGSKLYLEGATISNYFSDQIGLNLYLQKLVGLKLVDIQSWSFSKDYEKSIIDGVSVSYQPGNYYRTRAEHYIFCISQSETQNSSSAQIYV